MYAAAGGASIAKRRNQKRLQLNKRLEATHTTGVKKPTAIITGPQVTKPSRTHLAPQPQAQTSSPYHSSHCNHAHGHNRRRRNDKLTPNRLAPPVSPIFPISPPPLSLESQNSVTLPLKSSNFPFPPPSFLDLRSPSPSELQCGGQGPGKAAWQGCSRPSPLPLSPASPHGSRDGYKTKQCEAHRRWMKRNRIRDASYCYGSSGEDDDEDGSSLTNRRRGEVNAAFNTVLYAGLGTTALGLVISFVGTGEKGFLSPELRLVGPTLLCAGLLCCLLRVLLCICLCRCCGDCRWTPCRVVIVDKDKMKKLEPTATTLLPQTSQQTMTTVTKPTRTIAGAATASSSHSAPVKAHELLLSPAQLPE
ncbi:uncharacterized protein LOC107036549 [Diachasma alloeum]|uniref:uncharacterized protein LOC107036549 n=1 Tax=Diachasma alloeum TaxID=454923 RepID=UPI0007381CB4|nr:uncharacterized protein LOC107036549 [Diachasma alloeum]XP_015110071.1 uncharacterized protein LOC107036549 [Diachasma alloeum]